MIRTISLAAALLAVGVASSAEAGIRTNGLFQNGIRWNGVNVNGIRWNGIAMNGIRWNGIRPNGREAGAPTSRLTLRSLTLGGVTFDAR